MRATTDPAEAAAGADFTVLSVPSQTLRANLAEWVPLLAPDTVLVSLMKGVELGSAMRMSEVIEDVAKVGQERIAVVTGPNLAREIASRMPAASVVACTDEAVAQRLQAACHTPYFRPYTNTDVVGCELGGAVKNVIGLAVGMAAGMGLGDNTKATLITSQLGVNKWHAWLDEPTIADAILDRIVHHSHRIELKGPSLRKGQEQDQ